MPSEGSKHKSTPACLILSNSATPHPEQTSVGKCTCQTVAEAMAVCHVLKCAHKMTKEAVAACHVLRQVQIYDEKT